MSKWVYDSIKVSAAEHGANKDAENALNDFLFKGQRSNDSAFEMYGSMVTNIQNLDRDNSRGLILYGMAGTGKSYIVRRTLYFMGKQPDDDYVIIKGSSADPKQNIKIIYSTLFEHNGKIIVFDDFDSVLEDENSINLLKAALDSYPVRVVSLPSMASYSATGAPLPNKFVFTGKIIMITNKRKIDPALLSITQSTKLDFDQKQFRRAITDTLNTINPEVPLQCKQDVLDFFEENLAKDPNVTIDFRRFAAMVDLRVAHPNDWKPLCRKVLYPDKKL